jgi:hypothetical protein
MPKKKVVNHAMKKHNKISHKDIFYSKTNQKRLRESIEILEKIGGKVHELKE